MADSRLSRRRFLSAGSGAAAALALGGGNAFAAGAAGKEAGGHAAAHGSGGIAQAPPPAVLDTEYFQSWCEPPVEYSAGGVLNTTLRIVEAEVPIREPGRVRVEQTRTYNGIVPGPTFRVRPGDTMNIRMVNELPPNPDLCHPPDPNTPHCFNTTNLHTHGLHVSPLPPSDDVFLELDPGDEYLVCIALPDFHAPGTYWYHAHKHGSTAIQLVNGLAGALIVDDPPTTTPSPGARDRVMVLQEIIGTRFEPILYQERDVVESPESPSDVYTCTGGNPCTEELFTINGCYRPTLTMRPGEVQRWRFINATATPRGYTKLQFQGTGVEPVMCLIAVDGIYLPKSRPVGEWLLVPGGRADFLVQFPSGGSYQLLRVPTQGQCQNQVLADVLVGGTPLPGMIVCPNSLPPWPPYLAPITDQEWIAGGSMVRNLTFDIDLDPPDLPCSQRFLINNQSYDPDRLDHAIPLGAVEKWNVTNTSGASHPFHIHLNPFQVIAIGGVAIPFKQRHWQDTVDLPPGTTVTFYTRFQTFHGRFVLHCHILNHEDWGMMQNVEVTGYGVPPCAPVP
jgi:FtsP/CotA-like multicopper oxidase with cupredoxin domain